MPLPLEVDFALGYHSYHRPNCMTRDWLSVLECLPNVPATEMSRDAL
jgi:hypothetical protein